MITIATRRAWEDIPPVSGYPADANPDPDFCASKAASAIRAVDLSEDPESGITDMLVNLRHLCDALGFDFAQAEALAHAHYLAELCGIEA